ncbi:MAG: glycine cleavage system aminomethyltransferase GcvT [Kordiimonadaceae bacterium]|jgi:aminomethyltransferase|nr:glycine cleavage system aminomethyltransferase GcvT [Kordiimonadaceae bacterium]MBT6036036.1 glycine cleavage system aminomethyltransferase GcvT [Kordiimonadaceae bacterium]MBT6330300.1 glycine cleavage system aminomethyltransferase GcvT [Kordiimonadaceae bacterium]MBT7582939.1 glycine cleavage system aminomethyltransferase GcvT [Kordiimonadaceae bacterium]
MSVENSDLLKTPLYSLHESLGGKMVPFAGYLMPVQYPLGVMGEHNHTREKAGLFDVSHMGQVVISGENADQWLETLVPGNIIDLKQNRIRYTMFTDDNGGILDDLMITRRENDIFMVVNAGCKAEDIAHMRATMPDHLELTELNDRALVALQGPLAAEVLARFTSGADEMDFMSYGEVEICGAKCFISRCGYTGEDGHEISILAANAEEVCNALLGEPEVEAIGLGARDSLRLEAGLCLYGHDITTKTSPIEGALQWSIGKRRREQGGFPGADKILGQLASGDIARKRVGILPAGRAPAREGTEILDAGDNVIGVITSGGFGPTFGAPIAMGYVDLKYSAAETPIFLQVRKKKLEAKVANMPFVAQNYYRKPK